MAFYKISDVNVVSDFYDNLKPFKSFRFTAGALLFVPLI